MSIPSWFIGYEPMIWVFVGVIAALIYPALKTYEMSDGELAFFGLISILTLVVFLFWVIVNGAHAS